MSYRDPFPALDVVRSCLDSPAGRIHMDLLDWLDPSDPDDDLSPAMAQYYEAVDVLVGRNTVVLRVFYGPL